MTADSGRLCVYIFNGTKHSICDIENEFAMFKHLRCFQIGLSSQFLAISGNTAINILPKLSQCH